MQTTIANSKLRYVLPITTYAATKEGGPFPRGIPYPWFHTIVYYLGHKGVSANYSFNWQVCPKEEMEVDIQLASDTQDENDIIGYPNSLELAEDIFDLGAAGILHIERGSGMKIRPGDVFNDNQSVFLDHFEEAFNMKFNELSEQIQVAFRNPKSMLDSCYKWYINEL